MIKEKAAWKYAHKYMIYGLYNIVRLWSPELIVLGGGLMNNPNIKISVISTELKKLFGIKSRAVPILRKAKLGDYAGLYGSLYYLTHTAKK